MSSANPTFSESISPFSRCLRWTGVLITFFVLLQALLLVTTLHQIHGNDVLLAQTSAIVDNIALSESRTVAMNAGASTAEADVPTVVTNVTSGMDAIRQQASTDPVVKANFSEADAAEQGWLDAMKGIDGQTGLSLPKLASVFSQADALRAGLSRFSSAESDARTAAEASYKTELGVFAFLILATMFLFYFLYNSCIKQLVETHESEVASAVDQVDFLKRRNSILATTLESLTEAVVAVDKGSSIIYVNPVAEKLTGWQHEDAIGRTLSTVLTLKNEKTNQAIAGPISAVIADCMGHELATSTVIESRTGVKVPVEGAATPIWRGQDVTGAVLILRDSTERRAARQAQRASESLKEAIIESALDCVVLIDTEGKIVEFNPVAVKTFGSKREGMLGKSFFETALSQKDRARISFSFGSAVSAGGGQLLNKRIEVTAVKSDGSNFPAELAIAEIPGQTPAVYAAYLRDISDRKAAEAAVVHAREIAEADSKEKSMFLADMSDELRTPLNAVIGYTEMLQEEVTDDEAAKYLPDLEKIHSAGRQLQSMISEILDLSKIESGGMQLYLETFRVEDVIHDVVGSTAAQLAKNGNELEVQMSGNLGEMQSDRMKLRQGLLNLLSNASRFTSNRKLLLQATREPQSGKDWLTFRVTDVTGGIPEKEIESLAEAFAKGGTPSRARFGGRGLGLVIVQHFCEMMGGSVISKRDVGHSATFGMQLPAVISSN